jgi:hypothetical protein
MDKKKILIVTGTGGILGTGHLQRMLHLAVHLNSKNNFTASIYLTQNDYPVEEKLSGLITASIPADTDLIIKDMRDSTIEEMDSLRRIAPVLAIDDSGDGRDAADFTLSLLPVPSEILNFAKPETSLFLYGYNFAEGISLLKKTDSIEKDIDVTVYAGYNPDPELINLIKESVPESAFSVLLKEGKANNLKNNIIKTETPYAEIIARSKIVITHFGLTMFEADACGCQIIALNPTLYHSKLTEIVSSEFNIIYSAEYDTLSSEDLMSIVETGLTTDRNVIISPEIILKKINNGTDNFIRYIEKIINKR